MRADHGLSDRQLEMARRVLLPFSYRIRRVVVYGSRASGRYRPASDLDLMIEGDLSYTDVADLRCGFEDSRLAITVDVTGEWLITYEPLRRHIADYGRTLFTGEELRTAQPVG